MPARVASPNAQTEDNAPPEPRCRAQTEGNRPARVASPNTQTEDNAPPEPQWPDALIPRIPNSEFRIPNSAFRITPAVPRAHKRLCRD